MPTVDESGLRKRIGAGELSGLFVVAGEEKYLVKRLAQQLIKRAAGDAFPEFNNQSFTNDSSLDSVGDAARGICCALSPGRRKRPGAPCRGRRPKSCWNTPGRI